MAEVTIPVQYRRLTNNKAYFQSKKEKVMDIVLELTEEYPKLRPLFLNDSGKLRASVLLFVDNKDIRTLSGADTRVESGSIIKIVPAIAGG
jgi:molybdopterin converting factor small subunit